MTSELSAACRIGRDPIEVGRARELARQVLPGWGLGEHIGLAGLIVSELATNAVRHGDEPIEIVLSYACGDLWTEVHDRGAGRPIRRQAAADEERRACKTGNPPGR